MPRTLALATLRSPFTVWAAFVLVHLWLGLLNLYAPNAPLGDVTVVYKFWVDQALANNFWVGIDSVWVYPIVALLPMLAAAAFGPEQYGSTWLSMVMLLNAVAFGFVTGWGRSRQRVAIGWWWVGFLLLLGPIALGRIDSVSVPIAMVAITFVATRPGLAAILLTIATWIKVWPAALIAAALIALKERWRILAAALILSAGILVVTVLIGSGANVLSFITQQTGRGLQIESPIATVWLWMARLGVPMTYVYYDQQILTYQVQGAGVEIAAALMTVLQLIAVVTVVLLGVRATRRGVSAPQLLPALSLALVVALIVFNKVGSPQFISWLAVPIVLGLATRAAGHGGSFRIPATLGLVIALLTQAIYPYLYPLVLAVDPLMLVVLTVRNILMFVLLGWAVLTVVRTPDAHDPALDADEDWLSSVWPLGSIEREPVDE